MRNRGRFRGRRADDAPCGPRWEQGQAGCGASFATDRRHRLPRWHRALRGDPAATGCPFSQDRCNQAGRYGAPGSSCVHGMPLDAWRRQRTALRAGDRRTLPIGRQCCDPDDECFRPGNGAASIRRRTCDLSQRRCKQTGVCRGRGRKTRLAPGQVCRQRTTGHGADGCAPQADRACHRVAGNADYPQSVMERRSPYRPLPGGARGAPNLALGRFGYRAGAQRRRVGRRSCTTASRLAASWVAIGRLSRDRRQAAPMLALVDRMRTRCPTIGDRPGYPRVPRAVLRWSAWSASTKQHSCHFFIYI